MLKTLMCIVCSEVSDVFFFVRKMFLEIRWSTKYLGDLAGSECLKGLIFLDLVMLQLGVGSRSQWVFINFRRA